MRNVVLLNLITLDGFFEGLKQEIDWHHVDEEFHLFAKNQLQNADTSLFGRTTYHLMAGMITGPSPIRDFHTPAGPNPVFAVVLWSYFYSVLKISAGLVNAALAEWNIAVMDAVTTITKADNKKGITERPAL
jgi:hypothetical protein